MARVEFPAIANSRPLGTGALLPNLRQGWFTPLSPLCKNVLFDALFKRFTALSIPLCTRLFIGCVVFRCLFRGVLGERVDQRVDLLELGLHRPVHLCLDSLEFSHE